MLKIKRVVLKIGGNVNNDDLISNFQLICQKLRYRIRSFFGWSSEVKYQMRATRHHSFVDHMNCIRRVGVLYSIRPRGSYVKWQILYDKWHGDVFIGVYPLVYRWMCSYTSKYKGIWTADEYLLCYSALYTSFLRKFGNVEKRLRLWYMEIQSTWITNSSCCQTAYSHRYVWKNELVNKEI